MKATTQHGFLVGTLFGIGLALAGVVGADAVRDGGHGEPMMNEGMMDGGMMQGGMMASMRDMMSQCNDMMATMQDRQAEPADETS